jgi:hypothetical protein
VIGLCVPSRGLVFSRCMQSAIEGMQALNAVGIGTKYFYTHDLSIPDCHNTVVEKALADKTVDKIFFLEEDMYVDPQTFVALATSEYDISIVQYNDRNGSPNGIIHRNEQGEIIWTGLGAAVIKRKVFEDLGYPYFRIDHRYKNIKKTNKAGMLVTEFEELEPRTIYNEETKKVEEIRDEYIYGGLDVDFYTRVRALGYKIMELAEYKAHQFVLIKLGEPYQNKGCHEIRQV